MIGPSGQLLVHVHAKDGVGPRAEIVFRQLLLLSSLVFPLGGCAWAVRDVTDKSLHDLAARRFDIAPEPVQSPNEPHANDSASLPPSPRANSRSARSPGAVLLASASAGDLPMNRTPPPGAPPAGARTAVLIREWKSPANGDIPLEDDQVLAASWEASLTQPTSPGAAKPKLDLNISPRLPGSEAPRIVMPRDTAAFVAELDRIYPELSDLPIEPKVLPGPGGKPYTLADFQRLAAASSPTLRQAASDIEAAKGNLVQARTYPNPTVGYIQDTSAVNNTGGIQAGFIDQPIVTGGKLKLGAAATQKDLDNAILALKRARSDLATAVRSAYFTVLVDVETLVVTRALAQFSDDIYRLQKGLVTGTMVAPYEPTALRAQTYLNRLAYKQAIASYMYDWKALVATLGLPQLPLSEISGQVDRFIPYYDFDDVRAYILEHHTDVLTARNVVRKAQYNLKVAQVTPIFPNLDLYLSLEKDFMNPPHGTYQALGLGVPLVLWDRNKGNIIAAQGAVVRASEESHRVEVNLTNSLATAYEGYRNNLYAMEYYRRNILPNLVRYYRGVFDRRQIDQRASFGDLVFAQQNLSTNVTTYIGILGSLWSSVASVADYLQTDDLYQLGKRHELPQLPDLTQLPQWACGHSASEPANEHAARPGGPATAPPHTRAPEAGPPTELKPVLQELPDSDVPVGQVPAAARSTR
jgi:cobalt-zinc-cadmium efflux system outer membrane protein